MSSSVIERNLASGRRSVSGHAARWWTAAIAVGVLIAGTGIYGADYYGLAWAERASSLKHPVLRPSGTIGLRLGMFGVFLFVCLYMYPLRKRWRWLAQFGKTKNWLDFHVLFGISAPLVITLHSSLKFQGIAGVAYWLMIAVMASGVVGRYLYAKIPRRLNSAELSLADLEQSAMELTRELEKQPVLSSADIARAFRLPAVEEIQRLSLMRVLLLMFWIDVTTVFRVSRLRRSGMGIIACALTLGGVFPSRNRDLESAVRLARQRARIETKVVFLSRTNEIFGLWHVVHRPFSYAFATLAIVHIVFMVMLGYY